MPNLQAGARLANLVPGQATGDAEFAPLATPRSALDPLEAAFEDDLAMAMLLNSGWARAFARPPNHGDDLEILALLTQVVSAMPGCAASPASW